MTRRTIDDNKGQMRVIEALIACLLLVGGLSAATYISSVNVSVENSSVEESGENIFNVLCDSDVVHRVMEGGDFTEAQLKTLITTLLPPSSVFSVYFGSSMTNETLLNATNMGSGSYSSFNAFSGYGTFTISLPLSQVKYQPVDVILVMDVSGSMAGDKINKAKIAANTFVDKLNMTRDKVGLTSFSDEATLECTLTNNATKIKSIINDLEAGGATNMGGGISIANTEFSASGRSNATWVMILLSDGKANRPTSEDYARQYAIDQAETSKILKGKGVRIYTIGLGSTGDLDEELLRQIAFDESKYYYAPTADELETIYSAISKDILLQVRYDIVIIQLNIQGTG